MTRRTTVELPDELFERRAGSGRSWRELVELGLLALEQGLSLPERPAEPESPGPARRRYKEWSAGDRVRARDWAAEGVAVAEIARRLGASRPHVHQVLSGRVGRGRAER